MTLRRDLGALLIAVVCSGSGCVFRPIFNPPDQSDGEMGRGDAGASSDTVFTPGADGAAADSGAPPSAYCGADAVASGDGGYRFPDGASCVPVPAEDGGARDAGIDGGVPDGGATDASGDGDRSDGAGADGGGDGGGDGGADDGAGSTADGAEGDGAPGGDG